MKCIYSLKATVQPLLMPYMLCLPNDLPNWHGGKWKGKVGWLGIEALLKRVLTM